MCHLSTIRSHLIGFRLGALVAMNTDLVRAGLTRNATPIHGSLALAVAHSHWSRGRYFRDVRQDHFSSSFQPLVSLPPPGRNWRERPAQPRCSLAPLQRPNAVMSATRRALLPLAWILHRWYLHMAPRVSVHCPPQTYSPPEGVEVRAQSAPKAHRPFDCSQGSRPPWAPNTKLNPSRQPLWP